VNENYLRWPIFNQDDLSNADQSFLQLLFSRSNGHPKEFAILNNFWENQRAAMGSMSLSNSAGPGDVQPLVKILSAGTDGDIYGAIDYPEDENEYRMAVELGLWTEEFAKQLMVNQQRIYHFLEDVVTDIMAEKNEAKYKVDEEHVETQWKPRLPEADPDNDDEFRERRDAYPNLCRAVFPYTATLPDMTDYAKQIVLRRINIYEDHLRGLKSHPRCFMLYLLDIREHSHHVVSSSDNKIHPYISHPDLQNLSYATR
jgi:hypothetical protein